MKCELKKLEHTTDLRLSPDNEDDQRLLQSIRDVRFNDGRSIFYSIELTNDGRIMTASISCFIEL
jgi:hypothetical protein